MNPADIEKNKVMGGLAYFLFFLPLIACPESKYARFHANQGLLYLFVCFACMLVMAILTALLWRISWLLSFFNLVVWLSVFALGIIGMINGFTGKAKELPFIGQFMIIG